jgi:hypothetical protein
MVESGIGRRGRDTTPVSTVRTKGQIKVQRGEGSPRGSSNRDVQKRPAVFENGVYLSITSEFLIRATVSTPEGGKTTPSLPWKTVAGVMQPQQESETGLALSTTS